MLTLATIILSLLVWFVVTNFGIANSKMVPTPQAVWNAFIDIIQNGYKNYSLLQHLGASMERLFISFFFAALIAVPFGLASGYNSKIRAIFEPIIEFYRPLPPLAYYTLLVLWLGIGNESKITLLFLACFAPIYISCVSAVLKIKEDYINSAYTVGASKYQIFIHVILPSCLPDIFVGIRTAVGVAYTTLVAAEMVAAKSGLGWMVLDASNYLRITGILLDQFLRILEKKIVPWKGKE